QAGYRAIEGDVELGERGVRICETTAERLLHRLDVVEHILTVGDELAHLIQLIVGRDLAEDTVESDEDLVEVRIAVVERLAEDGQVPQIGAPSRDRRIEVVALPGDTRA